MPTIDQIWNETDTWFRDYAQVNRIATVILERLADDRVENECRFLCRLKWHLTRSYQEVSYRELQENVCVNKMLLLDALFLEIAAKNYEGIDEWAAECERDFPVIEDKWAKLNEESAALP